MRRKKIALEWKWQMTTFLIIGMFIGAFIGIGIASINATEPIETNVKVSNERVDAVWVGSEWVRAPLITWQEDVDNPGFFIVYCNDMLGDTQGVGDTITSYLVHETVFSVRMFENVIAVE